MSDLGDRLAIGYGDYGVNTGPIHALMLDPTTGVVTDEATLSTEETWGYRLLSGVQYVPFIDPRDTAQLAYNVGAGWVSVTTGFDVVHAFDIAETSEGLFVCGAGYFAGENLADGGPTIWQSSDGGATWASSLAPRPDDSGVARFYAMAEVGGVLTAILHDHLGSHIVYRRISGAWVTGETIGVPVPSDLVPFTVDAVDFAVLVPYGKSQVAVSGGATQVVTAPADAGQHAMLLAALPAEVRDAVVAAGVLYTLTSNGAVYATTSDGTLTHLFTSATTVTCLAVKNDTVFFGTPDSKIVSVPLPA